MILVVGGAGYIGSHVVKQLVETNSVVVLDNLSTGHRYLVDKRAVFVHGDLGDRATLVRIFEKYPIDAVMHFAANSLVGESVVEPMKYYKNNVAATLTLLETMMEYGVKRFIFSSTAAVYGIPNVDIITEQCPTLPINPYGRSKLMIEHMLSDFASAYDLRYVVLRYFNAAGAHVSGDIGEDHDPETHLIPLILQHLLGLRDKISVFGTDYDTPDGTCIRDYIHVMDLAEAHILALHALLADQKKTAVYNLGNGLGYSVKEVIDMCERVTEKKATIEYTARRPGDPARLVASSEKISRELGWQATRSLEEIITTAWNWHKKHM
ncbi:UDP-galactose-4-epimerase [Anoxybacillus gonensis]|uniref:UDP-glucose 4-epimerase n=1 Tax=Anoxybacillus gonensis TaxID=198467 RepID=A0AAW7TLG2_9BACL|nr:UDP-glucose 4-epimerase GalE [Anoxybacillus gonensis]AKS39578.1 UDP-galactose-4-epimerase [Anoxybacillus gonensis]KGP59619.1 UDP-galactose-4-epimerase [Anoxybacillus gonensis]MCX8046182.1 UDP-glucose 4-epimerase GalE [Anoxybacillus gonensis]MDO0878426.1 UDP-glucose 4-epimerase GalE [Anoxybacillus gonensis]